MAKVITDNKHYIAIADALRSNSFGEIEGPMPPREFAQRIGEISAIGQEQGRIAGYEQGVEAGKTAGVQSEYDRFWDSYQLNGAISSYSRAFCGERWNDQNFTPKYDIIATSIAYMFQSTGIADIPAALERQGVIFDSSRATNVTYAFNGNKITRVPVVSTVSASDLNTLFGWAPLIVTIEKLILKEDGTQKFADNVFHTCSALENIVIEGKIGTNGFNVSWSTKLTHDSLISIINALKDYSEDTSGTTWAITLGTTNLAKLTDAEKAIATQRGWTLA